MQPHTGVSGDAADALILYRALVFCCLARDGGDNLIVDGLRRTTDAAGDDLPFLFGVQHRSALVRAGVTVLSAYVTLWMAHRALHGLSKSRGKIPPVSQSR